VIGPRTLATIGFGLALAACGFEAPGAADPASDVQDDHPDPLGGADAGVDEPQVQLRCGLSPDLDRAAHHFMAANAMIRDGEELAGANEPVVWRLVEARDDAGVCHLTMRLCSGDDGASCKLLEVLGLVDGEVVTFETLHQGEVMNANIRVRLRSTQVGLDRGYYVELEGDSALAARKALAVKRLQMDAFTGLVVPGSKLAFDPSRNRTWKVVDARYDLRRGASAKTLDVYAYEFDLNFAGTFERCMKQETSTGVLGALVAPWDLRLAEL
jgi:hypothetical protein